MRFVGHVARMGVKNLKERDHLEDLGIDWRVTKWISRNGVERYGQDSSSSG